MVAFPMFFCKVTLMMYVERHTLVFCMQAFSSKLEVVFLGLFRRGKKATPGFRSQSRLGCIGQRRPSGGECYWSMKNDNIPWLGGGNSKIFYVHPYLRRWSKLTDIFQMELKPPTSWGWRVCWVVKVLNVCKFPGSPVGPNKVAIVLIGWSIWRIPDPRGKVLVFGLPGLSRVFLWGKF